jgi:Leucine-rich repeat (LRR) protein
LQNLEKIDLSWTTQLLNLPKEIGDLSSLNKLHLYGSNITSLPCSVGRLQNLEEIDLSYTRQLLNLPEEIGDLSSLNKLHLYGSNITSLPCSIGKLQNLEEIDLSRTEQLLNLPEEIGDLSSLKKLNLSRSQITSLPCSIGRLQNLKVIGLICTSRLVHVPREIGSLRNLEELRLLEDQVLSNWDIILYLVKHLPLLYDLGYNHNACRYELACNRARARIKTGFETAGEAVSVPPKLWPHLLNNATGAFNLYDFSVKKPDAIYQLLDMIERDSFIRLLINRK